MDETGNPLLLNGETQFDWLEKSGYVAEETYQQRVIEGETNSTYAWDHYNYDSSLDGVTLDDGNGRNLTSELNITTSIGETVSEQDFFGFDYGYFVDDQFPYFIGRYRGLDTVEPATTEYQSDILFGGTDFLL